MVDHSVAFEPLGRRVRAVEGTSLLEAARQAGVPIAAVCGGQGTCGRCRVRAYGLLNPLTAVERARLSAAEVLAGGRLACQARLQGPTVVHLPPIDAVVYKAAVPPLRPRGFPHPNVRKVYCRLPRPSLQDQRADLDRLCRSLGEDYRETDISVLRALPGLLRAADWSVTAVLAGGRLIAVEEGDTRGRAYGIAFDLGTTTAAAYAASLTSGQLLGAALATNRQTVYGADVISRLEHARAGGLARLRAAAQETLNRLTEELCRQVQAPPRHIYEAVVVGNPCMVQLLLGIDPYPIGIAPYIPAAVEAMDLAASEVGLDLGAGARVHILPAVSGYVGADAVADALVAAQRGSGPVRLLLDIGTNAEMVLWTPDRLLACAAAAGPAFEGARISCGMRAAPGAIDRVEIRSGRVQVRTLGDQPPLGLTGAGLVSAAAALRRNGLLSERGRFETGGPAAALFAHEGGRVGFILVPPEESGTGTAIRLTQQDITELLLAKGAIAAGTTVLLRKAGLSAADLDEVLIAGSFGNFLDVQEAMEIGLIPYLPPERVVSLGNAAGLGALQALLSLDRRRQAQGLARQIEYVEMSACADFNQEFIKAMAFPEAGAVPGKSDG